MNSPARVGSRCRYAALEALKAFIELVMRLAGRAETAEEILRCTISDLKELKMLYQMEITYICQSSVI